MTSPNKNINVLVIGCGVSGLTSGIRLLENNFPVTIIARDLTPDTTSDIPAAIWYPYIDATSSSDKYRNRVKRWASVTYKEGYKLNKETEFESGVSLITFTRLFHKESKYEEPWWAYGYMKIKYILEDDNLPPYYEGGRGYTLKVPLFETPKYMPYLRAKFEQRGGRIIRQTVSKISDLYDENRLIVNCTALGAKEVDGDDKIHTKRGQLIRVKALGINGCLADEDFSENSKIFGYIVPRPQMRDCILGGTAELNDEDLEPNLETAEEIKRRCRLLAPDLEIVEEIEHKVGLRPQRDEVRLEREKISEYRKCAVIHNYGHGGVGFTLAWGCADEVANKANKFTASE